MIFKGHKLTIGMDLGDRSSNYCVLDEAGELLLEQKLATTPEAMEGAVRAARLYPGPSSPRLAPAPRSLIAASGNALGNFSRPRWKS